VTLPWYVWNWYDFIALAMMLEDAEKDIREKIKEELKYLVLFCTNMFHFIES
jgi:hypothetical protein